MGVSLSAPTSSFIVKKHLLALKDLLLEVKRSNLKKSVLRAEFVRPILLERDIEAGDEFAADRAERGAMGFTLLALAGAIGLQFRSRSASRSSSALPQPYPCLAVSEHQKRRPTDLP